MSASILPHRASASRTTARDDSGSRTSATKGVAPTFAAAFSRSSRRRPVIMTEYPASTSLEAAATPMPVAPPVIMATLSSDRAALKVYLPFRVDSVVTVQTAHELDSSVGRWMHNTITTDLIAPL